METVLTATEKQVLVSSFQEITADPSAASAERYLQVTSWNLEEAIQLFFIETEGGGVPSSLLAPQVDVSPTGWKDDVVDEGVNQYVGEDGVRAPIPIRRETLYDDVYAGDSFARQHPSSMVPFRNFAEESQNDNVWKSNESASTANGSRDNLASLYRPPLDLMYHGNFDKAKVKAALEDKWLLVNLQSVEEFSSHMLNRDTWSNEAVVQTISSNFIFWQADQDTSEGKKVCTYYNLVSIPAILVIDPITGQKMHAWSGMMQPERLLEGLLPYMDSGPKDYDIHQHRRLRDTAQTSALTIPDKILEDDGEEDSLSVEASTEDSREDMSTAGEDETITEKDSQSSSDRKPIYLPLPEEPEGNRELLCRVGIRFPGGRRLQRNFLRTDPIKLLWSFCCSQLEEESRSFYFSQTIPGASRSLDYESNLTFEESGLSNSMLTLMWE